MSERSRSQPLQDQVCAWWNRAHTILSRVLKHRERANGQRQCRSMQEAASRMVNDYPTAVHVLLSGTWEWQDWLEKFQNPMGADLEVIRDMTAVAERASKRARGRALHQSSYEFRTWMATEAALPILHKSIKGTPQPAEELAIKGEILFHPKDILDHKVKKWHGLWQDKGLDQHALFAAFDNIREAAEDQQLPSITGDMVREAAHCMRPRAGQGRRGQAVPTGHRTPATRGCRRAGQYHECS